MNLHPRTALLLLSTLAFGLAGCPQDATDPSEQNGGIAGAGPMDLGPHDGNSPATAGAGDDSSPGTEPPVVGEPGDPGGGQEPAPGTDPGEAGGSSEQPPDGDPMMEPDLGAPTGTGPACGSRGLALCGDGQFCDFPESAGCGEADAPGTCEPIPSACTKELVPVCGCDGNTYDNACMARAEGVSVRHAGACGDAEPGGGDPGAQCGGLTGLACADDQFCDFPPDAICGAADGLGVCRTLPEICTTIFDPVCGCDGNTYSSACNAAAAGMSVASEGEC